MATKIVTKNSSTASAVPTASDLVQGELAVNVADKRLFTEDNAGAIVELGTNPSGNVTFQDNGKAIFGAGSDLQIYHDPSGPSSVVSDQGAGDLILRGSNQIRFQDATGAEHYAIFNENGAVQLYYDNAEKLATTSTGIEVTGTATMDGLTSFSTVKVDHTGDLNAAIQIGDPAALTSDTGVYFRTTGTAHLTIPASSSLLIDGTSSQQFAKFSGNGDISFYEDTGTTPKFFWDASAEFLGIGTSSPDRLIDLRTAPAEDWQIRLGANNSDADTYDIGRDTGDGLLYFKGNQTGYTGYVFDSIDGERARIDSSGNVGIGTTSPSEKLQVEGTVSATGMKIGANGTDINSTFLGVSSLMTFKCNGTERMRIDASGNLLVGTTSASPSNTNSFLYNVSGKAAVLNHASGTSSGQQFLGLAYNGGYIGSISQSGTTAVLYNTSSDQRLKENIADADDAGSKIDSIQVRKYDWKADGSHQDYGMIAQELQAVAPEAVSGDADSEEMMGVDYSKLVPMLVKEIQSLRNRVAQLEE